MTAKDDTAQELLTHIQASSATIRKANLTPSDRASTLKDLALAYRYVTGGDAPLIDG